jgi:hypothetical protein
MLSLLLRLYRESVVHGRHQISSRQASMTIAAISISIFYRG